MTGTSVARNVDAVPVAALVPFVLITFGITWGLFCLFILAPAAVTAVFGEISGRNPLWPDAQPYDMYLFCAAAVVVVWLNRRTMFERRGAAVGVVTNRYAQA